ncbi:MAG: fluoride efflux transporter CrcB [Endomicrobiales bacterium]|jgi:CrcB protein
MKYLQLIIGGSLGTLARYALAGGVYRVWGTSFPYGTLAVNLSGCMLIGFLAAIAESKFALSADLRVFLMIGFCGAFTTFSTLIFETNALMVDGQFLRACTNVLVSVVAGLVLFRLGMVLGKLI